MLGNFSLCFSLHSFFFFSFWFKMSGLCCSQDRVTQGRTVIPPRIEAGCPRWKVGRERAYIWQAEVPFHLQKQKSIKRNQEKGGEKKRKGQNRMELGVGVLIEVWTGFQMRGLLGVTGEHLRAKAWCAPCSMCHLPFTTGQCAEARGCFSYSFFVPYSDACLLSWPWGVTAAARLGADCAGSRAGAVGSLSHPWYLYFFSSRLKLWTWMDFRRTLRKMRMTTTA